MEGDVPQVIGVISPTGRQVETGNANRITVCRSEGSSINRVQGIEINVYIHSLELT